MARIAVVSSHDKRNFDSMLQAWATERAVALLGYGAATVGKSGLGPDIGRERSLCYLGYLFELGLYPVKFVFAGRLDSRKADWFFLGRPVRFRSRTKGLNRLEALRD